MLTSTASQSLSQVGIDWGSVKADIHPATARVSFRGKVRRRVELQEHAVIAELQNEKGKDVLSRACGGLSSGLYKKIHSSLPSVLS